MGMENRSKLTSEQTSMLLKYMEHYGDLSRSLPGLQGRASSDRQWIRLTTILNNVSGGVRKTKDKWKKVWADWKSKTKKKVLYLNRLGSGKGGVVARHQALTCFEKRLLAIIGPVILKRKCVENFESSRPNSPSPQLPETEADNELILLEVVDDELLVTPPSRPPISHQLASPSQSPSTDRLVFPASPQEESPTSPFPVLDSPPGSPLHDLRTPPPVSLPDRPQPSPTPQSAPPKPQMRRRLRRAPNIVERTPSHTTIELRRLELEESKARFQHERDMRTLDLEFERNRVFGTLVGIAQSWFEFYRRIHDSDPLKGE